MDSNKLIFITGSPHSGTTILRKIIGNHTDVSAIERETSLNDINESLVKQDKNKFVVAKSPYCNKRFCNTIKQYQYTKALCITRNPLEVFASLARRFPQDNPQEKQQRIETWIHHCDNCLSIQSEHNVMLVRYEDLFSNNYSKIKTIFDWIGLYYYSDIVLNNSNIPAKANWEKEIPKKEPVRTRQQAFRTYQINQPFVKRPEVYKDFLSEAEIKNVLDNERISRLMRELGYKK